MVNKYISVTGVFSGSLQLLTSPAQSVQFRYSSATSLSFRCGRHGLRLLSRPRCVSGPLVAELNSVPGVLAALGVVSIRHAFLDLTLHRTNNMLSGESVAWWRRTCA